MARRRRRAIAKVKLELEAGKATSAPVGRDLDPHGVNLAESSAGATTTGVEDRRAGSSPPR
jgi:ribosomal protein L11